MSRMSLWIIILDNCLSDLNKSYAREAPMGRQSKNITILIHIIEYQLVTRSKAYDLLNK